MIRGFNQVDFLHIARANPMASKISDSQASMEIRREIDACCQAFENAWKNGHAPAMEQFVAGVRPSGRIEVIRELLFIEISYRRNGDGRPLTDSQICALHPGLMPDIAEQAKLIHGRKSSNISGEAVTQMLAASGTEHEPTIEHKSNKSRKSQASGSRGLHIRCPHCSNPVELLTDTPFESITCQACGSAFSLVDEEEPTREAPSLKTIGRFDLVSRLGMGGFGTVWKARDRELDRTVAVKIPRKGQLAREEIEQFFREARLAAQLRHPNIVPVHEVGRDGDTIFIVSDLIRGVSMSDWLSGATPNTFDTARLLAIVAEALHHAHQKGVIHRDLKPSNILLDDDGQPHIMDFGLAKREVGEITITVEGNVLGTPAYMSPEQAAGDAHWTDRRTDIYSLGVVLFRMLTGELPFRGNAQMQIHQRLTEDPPDPRKLNKHLPRDICTICLKCLERDPNRRYNNAKELADEFGRYLRREPIESRPISRVERTLRWGKRNPALATATLLTVFLAIAGPVAAVVFQRQQAQLRSRIVENDNLISRYRKDIQSATSKIGDLRSQLDVWEGRANPWDFWPPKRDNSPRLNMVTNVLDHSIATLVKPLADGKYDHAKTARGYFGLAALADAVGKSADAKAYYRQARIELDFLRQEKPEQSQYARGVAECDMRLARLEHDTDAEAAEKHLKSARAIYRQLATEHSADPTFQINWLESELISSIATPADSRPDHLRRVQEISSGLAGKWPKDPDAIYRLACYLTQGDDVLSPIIVDEPTARTSTDSSPAEKAANAD